MHSRTSISRTSTRIRILLVVLFFLIPLVYGAVWFHIEQIAHHWLHHQSYQIYGGFTSTMKILGFCVSMLKGGVVMYGIWILIRLFGLYRQGIVFQAANVECFRKLSQVLFGWVISGLLTTPLISIIVTMNNPPGQRAVQISLQSADLTALVIACVLRVITKVMDDARILEEDMQLTV